MIDGRLRGEAWHRVHRWHHRFMATYYEMRECWLSHREATTNGHPSDREAYAADHPRPTFKAYLIATAGAPR
jgi:hypothetical protein